MVGQCHLELICLFTLCFTIHGTFQYLIHRNSCRRYALFKVDGKGLKVTGGVIASMQVNSLRDCLKQCLDTSNCKSFNYIATSKGENCQTLSNDKLTGSSFAAAGCNHYEPVAQTISTSAVAALVLMESVTTMLIVILAPVTQDIMAVDANTNAFSFVEKSKENGNWKKELKLNIIDVHGWK
eukprot:gene14813-5921_t